jgi:hypothetical protein
VDQKFRGRSVGDRTVRVSWRVHGRLTEVLDNLFERGRGRVILASISGVGSALLIWGAIKYRDPDLKWIVRGIYVCIGLLLGLIFLGLAFDDGEFGLTDFLFAPVLMLLVPISACCAFWAYLGLVPVQAFWRFFMSFPLRAVRSAHGRSTLCPH